MYKLVTNDSSAYALSILPFEDILTKKGVQKKVLCLAFGEEINTLAAVKEICGDELKTAVLTVYEDSTEIRVYNDYNVLEQITTATITVGDKDIDVLMAKMSQSTSIPDQIMALENSISELTSENTSLKEQLSALNTAKNELTNQVTDLSNTNTILNEKIIDLEKVNVSLGEALEEVKTANEELKESMDVVSDLQQATSANSDEIATIKEQIAEVDEDTLDLEGLKEHRIQQSKVNLANYLANNTVSSNCHGGVEAEYSMTQEKQTQLMAVIMMSTLNPDYKPSWNASGEVCTYDWTVDELQVLAASIEAVVRPLVSRQQTMEVEIRSAETIEEVKAVDISF